MGRALHELLNVYRPLQRLRNEVLVGRRYRGLAGNLVHVVAIRLRRGHAARRSVRLVEEPSVHQVGHDVADGRRTQPVFVLARECTRSYRLTCGDVGLNNGGEDLLLAGPDLSWAWHKCSSLSYLFTITYHRSEEHTSELQSLRHLVCR